ncbi:MAG: type I-B CRISPR-associated endonuclease Cas1b [candidate division WOR-3 bacterium]
MKKAIYLFSNGELSRKDSNIYFVGEDKKKQFIPVEQVREIYVFGEVSITKKLLEFLGRQGIIIHFYDFHERYVGSFYPKEHLNAGILTLKQAEHYLDNDRRINLARKFVDGLGKNMVKVLEYYINRGLPLEDVKNKILIKAEHIERVNSVERLITLEGNLWEEYYKSFDVIIRNPDFAFVTRSRRPPENRLNALISFGNSLLYSVVLTEIFKTHLDPRIGFLHTTNYRRFALNLDISEIFKPIIVDRLIFQLLNKKILKASHFDEALNGITLNEEGSKIFVKFWEEKLNSTISHPTIGENISYRRLIRIELYKLERHLLGEKEYTPFVGRW